MHQFIISVVSYGMDIHVIQLSYEYIMAQDEKVNVALRQNPTTLARWSNRPNGYCCLSYMNANSF